MLKNLEIGTRTITSRNGKDYWTFELLNEIEAKMAIAGIQNIFPYNQEYLIPLTKKLQFNGSYLFQYYPVNVTYDESTIPYRIYMEQSGKYFLEAQYADGYIYFSNIDTVALTIASYLDNSTTSVMVTTSVDIIMAKSPYWVNFYANYATFDCVEIDLFIWDGDFNNAPITPNYTLTAYPTTPTSGEIHVNISDYLQDLIDPLPTSTFFGDISLANFHEIVNFKYVIRHFHSGVVKNTIVSDLKMATLGYGLHMEGVNPSISLYVDGTVITIDSVDITIDSGIVTIDSGNNNKLIVNQHKYHTYNTFVYNSTINPAATGTHNIIKRVFTNDYKLVCSGINNPRQIMYLDRNGLLDAFTFAKTSKRSVKLKNDKYNKGKATPWAYNTAERTSAIANKNGEVVWTVNTDLLDEINVNYIEQLMASDRHWLVDYDAETFIPININDTEFLQKTGVNDKAKMQYTLTFTEANDYINNIK